MVSQSIQQQLNMALERMAEHQQMEVVRFAESLAAERRRGISGQSLLDMAGTISPEDADRMSRSIQEECERVHPDEW